MIAAISEIVEFDMQVVALAKPMKSLHQANVIIKRGIMLTDKSRTGSRAPDHKNRSDATNR
jgi:hypothetical protein